MPKANSTKPDKASRWWLLTAAVALAVLTLLRLSPADQSTPNTAGEQATNVIDAKTEDPKSASFRKLQGRWLRPDGGYILDLRWVSSDGQVDAAYFNPRPIYVSRAEAAQKESGIEVMVELQDDGYPGCIYTLLYNAENDTLTGRYYQAAMRETFEVFFERAP